MAKKMKPNKLFEEKPAEAPEAVSEADAIGADANAIVGNGRMSAEDANKLEKFDAMEKSLAMLASEKSALEAKVAEYVEKLEASKSSSDEIAKLKAEIRGLESKCKSLEEKASRAQALEKEASSLRDENDQYLVKISELTFENASLTCQLSELEKKSKSRGHIANQSMFQPNGQPQNQMMKDLAPSGRDAYNPYANNGYGTW